MMKKMTKQDIISTLQKNDSTVLSFPERGPWGDNRYRGNCSGYVQAFLIWKYHVRKFAELFAGSGTGYDVCRDMGVDYAGADLNPVPVRPGILSLDAFRDEVPESFYGADMVFMHPPYGMEIGIPYAGSMYEDPTGELAGQDLGQMSWDKFIKVLNAVIMKYYTSMQPEAYMSVLMGDVRKNGQFHSMLSDIVKPGDLEQIIIKTQHHTMSERRSYANRNFVPLVHEYIMVLKKTAPYLISYTLPEKHKKDVRDAKKSTWCDVVFLALKKLGGKASLNSLYGEIDGHLKTKENAHWREKVRQVLQKYSLFISNERGIWQLA